MTEIVFETAEDAARLIRRREVSSRELAELLLAQIDAVNPRVNAIVEIRAEGLLRDASAADVAVARGEKLGPLHGVPMTIKDAFDVTGMHTTWGNPAFQDYIAPKDAVVVRRLREAGALIAGKSNEAFMLADFGQTANELHGVTRNPWDLDRTPGGSTGGGAAALASGLTFLEYGSDLVGSIRIPASFCGVYGLKPTAGIVPLTGFQPPGPPAPPSEMNYMSSLGPLTRSAADLRSALQVTAGPDGRAAASGAWSLPAPRHRRLSEFRVGVVLDHPNAPVTSEVGDRIADTLSALSHAGVTVVDGWPEGIDPVDVHETFGFHVEMYFAFQGLAPTTATLTEFIERERRRMAVRAAWERYFENMDVFLCPVTFTPPFPHDSRPFEQRMIETKDGDRPYTDLSFWVSHASLPGLPAVSAPIGITARGLPVGLQVIGPQFEDDTPIKFAELLAEIVGGYERPPR